MYHPSSMIWLYLSILSIIITPSNAAGFDYPPTMPGPHEVISYNNVLFGLVATSNGLETPIAIRVSHIGTVAAWNCVAQYDANALDAITKQRPIVDELPDDDHLNSYTRSLCLQYTYIKVLNVFYDPIVPYYTVLFTLWGLQNIDPDIDPSVTDCNHDSQCLTELARDHNFEPEFMSNIIANEIIEEFMNDGWNFDGSLNSAGECTANCKPYTDTTGYQPQQQTAATSNGKKGGKGDSDTNDDDFWVPLLETDYEGFFYRHEHVTPHIGFTAKKWLIDEFKTAEEPNYDYDEEVELTLERLSKLAVNDTMKMMVEFFDNKLVIRGMIGLAMMRQYPDTISFEDFVNYVIGISSTEHDTLLQAWNQKIEYDLIRPTTIVQRRGSELITTYGGPYQGVQTFEAKDFEPYIRVMPHSEYPSGSACLCVGYMDFVHEFVKNEFGDDELYNLQWYRSAGSSRIEPDVTPKEDMIITLRDMEHLYEVCSESRLWGGMHFTASIHSAKEICSGVGSLGYEFAAELKKDSNFLGSTYPSDSGDIEELWLPFVKLVDFVATFSFSDLIAGNIDFDPEILKILVVLIPDVDGVSDIADPFGLLSKVILYLQGNLVDVPVTGGGGSDGMTKAPSIPTEVKEDGKGKDKGPKYAKTVFMRQDGVGSFNEDGNDGTQGVMLEQVMVLLLMLVVSVLFLVIGVCFGIRYFSSRHVMNDDKV